MGSLRTTQAEPAGWLIIALNIIIPAIKQFSSGSLLYLKLLGYAYLVSFNVSCVFSFNPYFVAVFSGRRGKMIVQGKTDIWNISHSLSVAIHFL